jgi:hypothetical protein
MTVKLSHDRKVRSLAKKTLGSTRVGRAMRLPFHFISQQVNCKGGGWWPTWSCLEERLGGHDDRW